MIYFHNLFSKFSQFVFEIFTALHDILPLATGLTLRRLQQDLLESKNSMAKSENFMKQLTKEFAPVVARQGRLKKPELYK